MADSCVQGPAKGFQARRNISLAAATLEEAPSPDLPAYGHSRRWLPAPSRPGGGTRPTRQNKQSSANGTFRDSCGPADVTGHSGPHLSVIRTVFPPDRWRTRQWVPNASKIRRPHPNVPRGRPSNPRSPRTARRPATPAREWPVPEGPRVRATPLAETGVDGRDDFGRGKPRPSHSRRQVERQGNVQQKQGRRD